MTTYYCDDGGSNTSPYDTWAKAATTLQTVLTLATSAGDIIKVETTHRETSSTADIDLNATTNAPGPIVVRVDSASSDAYDPGTTGGTTENFEVTSGNYEIDINNNVTIYGLRFKTTEILSPGPSSNRNQYFKDCYFTIGDSSRFQIVRGWSEYNDCIFNTQDIADDGNGIVWSSSSLNYARFTDCDFTGNISYRNVICNLNNYGQVEFVGCDFSAMTRNPTRLMGSGDEGKVRFIDCDMPPNYECWPALSADLKSCEIIRCNGTDEYEYHDMAGSAIDEATIVRTGGASKTWECTTTTYCGATLVFYTPWIYGVADAAASKNFDIHIAYSGTQLTEENIFMELELIDSATAPYGSRVTSQKRAVLGDTVGNHTTASETWGGTETYEEYIRITQTVGVADTMVRARIGIEIESQTDEIYVDPYLEIS